MQWFQKPPFIISRPTHPHIALRVDDLQPLLDSLRFLARALALLLWAWGFYCGNGCCCAGWFGADVVEVSFAWNFESASCLVNTSMD